MLVIGVVGRNGSGKDTLIDYVSQRCNISVLSMGDIVRDIAEQAGIRPTRKNLHEISQRYFDQHGKDYFAQKLVQEIQSRDLSRVGITGVRTPTDVQVLQNHFGQDFILIHVQVDDPYTRFERLKQRDDPRDPETLQDFLRQEREEEALFHISETIQRADVTVQNEGTLEDFYRRIEERIIQEALADRLACD